MIVAKTKMKKIPMSCKECPIARVEYYTYVETQRFCGMTKKQCPKERTEAGNLKYILPKWCPLIEVKNEKLE